MPSPGDRVVAVKTQTSDAWYGLQEGAGVGATIYVGVEGGLSGGPSYDFVRSYTDGGTFLANYPGGLDPNGERTAHAPSGMVIGADGALHVLRVIRIFASISSIYFPDSPDAAGSQNNWKVETFTDGPHLAGHSTLTLLEQPANGGYGNTEFWTHDLQLDASGNFVTMHRNSAFSSDRGFIVHDKTSGLQIATYITLTGGTSSDPPKPSLWQMAPDGATAYGIYTDRTTLLKGPFNNWASASSFYQPMVSAVAVNIACFCVNRASGDVFVGYMGGGSGSDILIDRVSSAGSLIQTYGPLTTTRIAADPSNSSQGSALGAFGNTLVANPYFADSGTTTDFGTGVWVIDIATGAGVTDSAFDLASLFGAPPVFQNVVNCFLVAPPAEVLAVKAATSGAWYGVGLGGGASARPGDSIVALKATTSDAWYGLDTSPVSTAAVVMLLSNDSFNRVNLTTPLGSTDGAGSLDPLTWTNQQGACGIDSNRAYGSTAPAKATVDLGTADCTVQVTIVTMPSVGNALALLFRLSDASNFWQFWGSGSGFFIYKVVAGTWTQVGGSTPMSVGDVIKVTCSGSSITAYRNGTAIGTLTGLTDSFNSTATRHGLYFEDGIGRFDNWLAYSA